MAALCEEFGTAVDYSDVPVYIRFSENLENCVFKIRFQMKTPKKSVSGYPVLDNFENFAKCSGIYPRICTGTPL